jgi:2-methylcitrate dehydratase PrpD
MNGLTEALAAFIADPGLDRPSDAASVAKSGIVDSIGTMIAGRDEEVVRVVRQFVRARRCSVEESRLLMGRERGSAADAALINGTAAHALDYDDVALGGHPSTVLMPALIAEAQACGASGAEVLRAYVVGYEVWAELIWREPDAYHVKGWHPTGVCGTVASAASVAHLRQLPVGLCRNAIAIAASMASGLVANFGSMTKPLHAGRAAAAGIEAVRLAQAGLTAAPDVIEHQAGYLAALSPHGRADRESRPAIGSRLRIVEQRVSIKRYPVCYATHRVIDGVLALAEQHDIWPDDVTEVSATIGDAQASMLRNHAPKTALEAKFSLEFAVASALVARRVGLRELTDEFVNDPQVSSAMSKVRTATTSTRCPIEPVFAISDRVVIRLADGRTVDSGDIRFPRGNAMLPLDATDLRRKFLDCCSRAGDVEAAARLYEQLGQLERIENVSQLYVI